MTQTCNRLSTCLDASPLASAATVRLCLAAFHSGRDGFTGNISHQWRFPILSDLVLGEKAVGYFFLVQ